VTASGPSGTESTVPTRTTTTASHLAPATTPCGARSLETMHGIDLTGCHQACPFLPDFFCLDRARKSFDAYVRRTLCSTSALPVGDR
jgi:hypothetical protein